MTIIDMSGPATAGVARLHAAGVSTVIRYYARLTHNPAELLTRNGAETVIAQGMSLAVVHEGASGGCAAGYDQQSDQYDAAYARQYAAKIIGQPAGSAIYFAVDFDANPQMVVDTFVPYFQGVIAAMTEPSDLRSYTIGVYGCGTTCKTLQDAGIPSFTWLSQSQDHSPNYHRSIAWTLFQHLPSQIAGYSVDVDELNPPSRAFGKFEALTSGGWSFRFQGDPMSKYPHRAGSRWKVSLS